MYIWLGLVILDVVVGTNIVKRFINVKQLDLDVFFGIVCYTCLINSLVLFGIATNILGRTGYTYIYAIFILLSVFYIEVVRKK